MNIEENIKRFEELMSQVKREGIENLMNYIRTSDFYSAPASTRFHLSCKGGLVQHSLNVYDCLMAKKNNPIWQPIMAEYSDESLIIMALLHDLCKTYFYVPGTKNQKTYEPEKVAAAERWQVKNDAMGDFIWETVETFNVEDKMPLGHGEKSVMLVNNYIRLESAEMFAIRWHMGYSEEKSQYNTLGQAMEKYPIVLALHEADLEASKLLEGENDNK